MPSSLFDPPPMGLDAAEIDARFATLQEGLVTQWKLIQSMNQLEQSMVVIPSVSVEVGFTATIQQAYEERMLFLLLLLRKARAHIIYCTSQPIRESIVDYYLGLLPGVIPSHARARLTTVAVHDASARPLTLKILERPRLVQRLKDLIPDPSTTHMVPFNTTELERHLALRLGIPMYASDPQCLELGAKSGGRTIFAALGIPHPRGREALRSTAEVVEAVHSLRSELPSLEQALIKHNHGVSGEGNATINLGTLPPPGSPGEDERVGERIMGARLESPSTSIEEFLRTLAAQGGVLEERLVGEQVRSPSVQLRITPLGTVEVLSTHDQLLGGSTGLGFVGCTFPASPEYAAAITGEAVRVGEYLRERGVLGRFAVDFLVLRDGADPWQVYAIEINLRKGGTTGPYLTLEFLTNGHYDPQAAVFTTPFGTHKCYVASDHVHSPSFRAISTDDLFDFLVRHGLHFDHTTQSGVVLHMLSALSEEGRFGLTAVADTHDEARELYDRTLATLGFEADRASEDPGLT